jgi:hypothetical protein
MSAPLSVKLNGGLITVSRLSTSKIIAQLVVELFYLAFFHYQVGSIDQGSCFVELIDIEIVR